MLDASEQVEETAIQRSVGPEPSRHEGVPAQGESGPRVCTLDKMPGTGVEVALFSLPGLPVLDHHAERTTIEILDAGNVSSITRATDR